MSPELDMDVLSPLSRFMCRGPHASHATCTCGTTTISVNGEPEIHGVCHCLDCQRRTGSAFGIAAYFRRDEVTRVKGETLTYSFHHGGLNHDQERHFCKVCGTTLFWYISSLPDLVVIAGGCFTDSLGEPTLSVSHSRKAPWL